MLGTFVKECYRAEMKARKPYPTDVSDEEWSFAAPYLT
ncbi:transposase, partial [Burkholderia ubonensis]